MWRFFQKSGGKSVFRVPLLLKYLLVDRTYYIEEPFLRLYIIISWYSKIWYFLQYFDDWPSESVNIICILNLNKNKIYKTLKKNVLIKSIIYRILFYIFLILINTAVSPRREFWELFGNIVYTVLSKQISYNIDNVYDMIQYHSLYFLNKTDVHEQKDWNMLYICWIYDHSYIIYYTATSAPAGALKSRFNKFFKIINNYRTSNDWKNRNDILS